MTNVQFLCIIILGEFMRLKHIKGSEDIVNNSDVVIKSPETYRGNFKSIFGNNNKIYLEVGMGKGSFIIKHAKNNPNINYIGFEKYPSVLISAIKTIEEENITNLRIICADAINIDKIFYKEISKLYLNFSDPWPKKRHEKRRLTSEVFLSKYDSIFKRLKVIEQKTDNDNLFSYSVDSFKSHGYFILKKSTNYFDNIRTEYEEKFISKGKNINYVKVVKL